VTDAEKPAVLAGEAPSTGAPRGHAERLIGIFRRQPFEDLCYASVSMHRGLKIAYSLTALLAVAIHILVYRPGYMSGDSVTQLTEGRLGTYNGWHPPIMSWLWGQLDAIVPGPIGMLALHDLVFFGSLTLIFALSTPRWWGPLAVLFVGLW